MQLFYVSTCRALRPDLDQGYGRYRRRGHPVPRRQRIAATRSEATVASGSRACLVERMSAFPRRCDAVPPRQSPHGNSPPAMRANLVQHRCAQGLRHRYQGAFSQAREGVRETHLADQRLLAQQSGCSRRNTGKTDMLQISRPPVEADRSPVDEAKPPASARAGHADTSAECSLTRCLVATGWFSRTSVAAAVLEIGIW